MEHTDAYVDILVTSLRKKVTLLEKIENVITEQERELKKPNPDIDRLDEIKNRLENCSRKWNRRKMDLKVCITV